MKHILLAITIIAIAVLLREEKAGSDQFTMEATVQATVAPFIRLRGSFQYKQPSNFHLVLGKELEIGSNERQIWYWSAHLKPAALYYADRKDLYQTRLKPAFEPDFMLECLGLLPPRIETKIDNQTYQAHVVSPNGKKMLKITKYKSGKVCGHYLFEENGKLNTAVEVSDYQGDIPTVLRFSWYDPAGTARMQWKLSDIKTNIRLKEKFLLPGYHDRINMATD